VEVEVVVLKLVEVVEVVELNKVKYHYKLAVHL
jgi:hypothetical protein